MSSTDRGYRGLAAVRAQGTEGTLWRLTEAGKPSQNDLALSPQHHCGKPPVAPETMTQHTSPDRKDRSASFRISEKNAKRHVANPSTSAETTASDGLPMV
jgi:hypothetical protein